MLSEFWRRDPSKDRQQEHWSHLETSQDYLKSAVDYHIYLVSMGFLHQTGVQYSAIEKTRACVEILSILAEAPQVVPVRWRMNATLVIFDLTVPSVA